MECREVAQIMDRKLPDTLDEPKTVLGRSAARTFDDTTLDTTGHHWVPLTVATYCCCLLSAAGGLVHTSLVTPLLRLNT